MKSLAARVVLRYVAGYLLLKGVITHTQVDLFSNPDVVLFTEMAIGLGIGAVAEGWLVVTKRAGRG